MTPHALRGARLLAGVLAVTLLPGVAFAQNTTPPPHPWKQAYARRMAEERMEQRRARDLLRAVMEAESFHVNEYEWWHFDFKDWQQYSILNLSFAELSH